MTISKPKKTDSLIQLLKTEKSPSIGGSGTEIRYSIGVDSKQDIWLKIVGSSGGGQINNAWFRFTDIHEQLEKHAGGGSFTSSIFSPVFADVSANMAPFTLAVAMKEKLVLPQEGKRRKFLYNSPAAFLAKVDKLIAAKAIKKSPRRKTKAATQSRVSA
jgi:hypothetical protein